MATYMLNPPTTPPHGDRPPCEMKHARGVAGALPRGKVLVMPGQQHAAMYVAPEEFVDQATRFLQE